MVADLERIGFRDVAFTLGAAAPDSTFARAVFYSARKQCPTMSVRIVIDGVEMPQEAGTARKRGTGGEIPPPGAGGV